MKFDRKTLLSLKLRQQIGLKKLSRNELFSRLQLIRSIEPLATEAYNQMIEDYHRDQTEDAPHGNPWHVSFHASQFPGDNPMACPRQSLYRMMDFPVPEPVPRSVRMTAIVGKALELDLVRAFDHVGVLISAPPDEEIQTGFVIEDAWMTGSVDAVIKQNGAPVPIEIKTKHESVVKEMLSGKRGPDAAHVFQLKTQLGLVAMFQEKIWPGMKPVTHGYIYYMARDNDLKERRGQPPLTAEFRVDLDERFFNMGLQKLKEWRSYFENDELPEIDPSKRHPLGWRWSYPPCQFCPFKKTCKLDFQQGITQLSESVGVERARLIRPDYDPEEARQRVLDRWKNE